MICVTIHQQKKTIVGCTLKEYIISVECVMLKLILKKSFKLHKKKALQPMWKIGKICLAQESLYGDIYDIYVAQSAM